jgi:tRNA threonylcarbamoyladenosine biosynthesis protein TsaB
MPAFMNLLAIECSTGVCSVALSCGGAVHERLGEAGRPHSEILLPLVDTLLSEAGFRLGRLDAIAFGAGPGGFTGLRLAASVAQGLAFGSGLPLVAVSSLEALARGCGAPRVWACLDARMNEVYCAAYGVAGDEIEEMFAPQVVSPDAAPPPPGTGWLGAGSGFSAYPHALAQRLGAAIERVDAAAFPRAAAVAALGAARMARGQAVPPERAALLYVRDKVALTTAERLGQGMPR